MKLPAGNYYVGDLCYVLGHTGNDRWDEVCDLIIDGHNVKDGIFTMSDGTVFAIFSTAYGDGTYSDQFGNEYCVDAGSIGCVLLDSIPGVTFDGLGHAHKFDNPFTVESNGKQLGFGHLTIDTDPSDDDEDYNDDLWEEEDEDM